MGRVSHHRVLDLGDLGAQEDPGLVLDVENPQLAGHVSSRVDLSSVNVDLPLEEAPDHSFTPTSIQPAPTLTSSHIYAA